MAEVGKALPTPEEGWKRYDDTDVNISMNGFSIATNTSYYNGSVQRTNIAGSTIKFNYTGKDIRIISTSTVDSGDATIKIDGKIIDIIITNLTSSAQHKTLVYEKTGLSDGEHSVEITTNGSKFFYFDAIDIDANGELKPFRLSVKKCLIFSNGEYKRYVEGSDGGNTIPKMVSNNEPSGVASSSGIYQGNSELEAWKAFDDDPTTFWVSDSPNTPWIAYNFEKPIAAVRYAITNRSDVQKTDQSPTAWVFEGSSEESDWTVLDSQSNIVWTVGERKEFFISNAESYSKYRLSITKVNGSITSCAISEFEIGSKSHLPSWQTVSTILPTPEQFQEEGMEDLTIIPEEEWAKIGDFEVVTYSSGKEFLTAHIEQSKNLYSGSNLYKGQGAAITETETLPPYRKHLMIHADHDECLFEYSLDHGDTWKHAVLEEAMDISTEEGNELIIKVTFPHEEAELRSISYGWA